MFNFVREKLQNNGIFCLQETHSTISCEEQWKKEWGGELIFSHGLSNARGVIVGFSKNLDVTFEQTTQDKNGRILILDVTIDSIKYTLINLYNANSENDQVNTLNSFRDHIKRHTVSDRYPIFMGDLNMIFDTQLDALGGTPSLKKRSIASFIKIQENLDVSDIFRIRFPYAKRFTFRQKSRTNETIHRRLDYIFLSNSLQEFAKKIEVLPSFLSDHSPVLLSLNHSKENDRGKGLWKFNNSLLQNIFFEAELVNVIKNTFSSLTHTDLTPHVVWEILKYEIRKFCIRFSILKSKENKAEKLKHESVVQKFENIIDSNISPTEYANSKSWIENWHDEHLKGIILRSKSDWFEKGEKSTKYFLNLEKSNSVKNTIRKLCIVNEKKEAVETDDETVILKHAHDFYKNLFQRKSTKSLQSCSKFLEKVNTPFLTNDQKTLCDQDITLDELTESLESMKSGKSPGNDGLTIEFYKMFWEHLKSPLLNSLLYSKIVGELSTSQRQAIIKLLEKKEKDKRFINNWRPISLLNVDTKIISKALSFRLKKVLPFLVNHDQTAYVNGRFIGESTRLISDILEITDSQSIGGYMLTADIEKAFDSMDHQFLFAVLNKLGFGNYFIEWIQVLLNRNESCVINGGTTSKYFELQRGARQGDPIAAYLFIICLEIFFIMVRSNQEINGLKNFQNQFLLSAYADDTTFFVDDIQSIHKILDTFDTFSKFSGFNLNKTKCEICGIGVKKGEKTALCTLNNVNLLEDSVKILGVHYSYNKNILHSRNFTTVIKKIEKVLQIWKSRSLSLSGKIVIFKTLAISKIVYISYMSSVPEDILALLESVHKDFIWNGKNPKIKHSTLINDYSNGGLRDIDIRSKIKALQLSWLKRLYDNNFHPWKIIPTHLFSTLGPNIFYPNLSTEHFRKLDSFPLFYMDIVRFWCEISSSPPITSSSILSECVYNNAHITIANSTINYNFLGNIPLFVKNFFDEEGLAMSWNSFKRVHMLPQKLYFKWLQLLDCLPVKWKEIIKLDRGRSRILCDLQPHLIFKASILAINKFSSQEFYKIFLCRKSSTPTSQKYIQNMLGNQNLPWKQIYNLPRAVTIDVYTRIFQYKCLNNILYLNNALYKMKITDTPLCSYCKEETETQCHLFYECVNTKMLWHYVVNFFQTKIDLPPITVQSAFVGFLDVTKDDYVIANVILLSFKITLYKQRNKQNPTLETIVKNINKREIIEKSISFDDPFKRKIHLIKWSRVISLLQ